MNTIKNKVSTLQPPQLTENMLTLPLSYENVIPECSKHPIFCLTLEKTLKG